MGYSLSSIDISPGLRPGEDTPASPHSVDTTRVVVVTSDKSESIGVEKDARDYNRRWERFRSHWTTTARLNLGSPQTIRCCPATVCLPHRVHGDQDQTDKQTAKPAPGKNQRNLKNRCPVLKLGSWNVRTMTPGYSEDLQDINDARKTAVINNELLRLQVDIAALQETRLADSGTLKEKDFTFFWQGKSVGDRRENGVGFAVKNTLLKMVKPGENGSDRLMTLHLRTSDVPITLVSAYAPTLTSTAEAKDEF